MAQSDSPYRGILTNVDNTTIAQSIIQERALHRFMITDFQLMNPNEMLTEIQNIDISSVESVSFLLKQLKTFFAKYSIDKYQGKDLYIETLLEFINSTSEKHVIFGLQCFYTVFCQNNFSPSIEFAMNIIENIKPLLFAQCTEIIKLALGIIVSFSASSKSHSRIISMSIDPTTLCMMILDDFDYAIKYLLLFLLGNFCSSIEITSEFVNNVFNTVDYLISDVNCTPKLMVNCIWCITEVIRRYKFWFKFFEQYQLDVKINNIFSKVCCCLENSEFVSIIYNILRLIDESFKSKIFCFDLERVLSLTICHHVPQIQIAALICIHEYILWNTSELQTLLDLGLINNVFNCFENSSFQGKIKCIDILADICGYLELERIVEMINAKMISYLLEILQIVPEKPIFRILEILITILTNFSSSQVCMEAFITSYNAEDGNSILFDFSLSNVEEIASDAKIILELCDKY